MTECETVTRGGETSSNAEAAAKICPKCEAFAPRLIFTGKPLDDAYANM